MKKHFSFVPVAFLALISSTAQANLITFDEYSAPNVFIETTKLTELYAPQGVHFSGPNFYDGGAIVNHGGQFWGRCTQRNEFPCL